MRAKDNYEMTAWDEAIEEGEVRGCVKIVLRQGSKRFGVPSAAIESEPLAIKDLGRLERLVDALLTANSWQEFLATP
jgi:hypothetical protein